MIENIRRACGEDFILGLAVSYSVALSAEYLCKIIDLHEATGHVDYVTGGFGSYLEFESIIPAFTPAEKLSTPLTVQLNAIVKHAVITSETGVRRPENAEAILSSGEADLASIVCSQIADLHLARKTTEGRSDAIRGCISCKGVTMRNLLTGHDKLCPRQVWLWPPQTAVLTPDQRFFTVKPPIGSATVQPRDWVYMLFTRAANWRFPFKRGRNFWLLRPPKPAQSGVTTLGLPEADPA